MRDAVVLAREDEPGDRRLVAYCVADEGLDVESLRAHLAERLPSYMVPAAFVRLDAFPVTAGGKVDRRALPAPEGDALALRGYEAPEGETEQALAEIWAEVLRVERVGRRDSFFDLGGHSLLAVQVISRVRQRLAVEVALRDLFDPARAGRLRAGAGDRVARRAAADRAGGAGGGPPALLRAAAALVHRTAGGRGRGVPHPRAPAAAGRAGPGRAAAGAGPDRGAARGAAHHLRRGGRRAGAADRAGGGEPVPARGARPPRRRRRGRRSFAC